MVTNWLVLSVALTAVLFFVSEKQDTIVIPQIRVVAIAKSLFLLIVYRIYMISFTRKPRLVGSSIT